MTTGYNSEETTKSDKRSVKINGKKPALFARNGDKDTVLADFEIKKLIGRGSYGKVFLIEKKNNPGEVYAMKTIEKETIIDEDLLESAKLENEILQQGNHPFLMGTQYVFQTDNKLMFVMPFAIGGELFELKKRKKRFTEEDALFYIA